MQSKVGAKHILFARMSCKIATGMLKFVQLVYVFVWYITAIQYLVCE